jgi:hypothetical protein
MGRASVLGLLFCAAACAAGARSNVAALGWSLGGEAHVFIPGDRFARDLYRELTGNGRLADSLARRPLVAVDARVGYPATVLSANGAAPARLTLARFHASGTCGSAGVVTELVLAFPPGGSTGHSTPRSHVAVVALVDAAPFAGGAGTLAPPLSGQQSIELVRQISERADAARGELIGPLAVDPDRAADAGEVTALPRGRYAVGFRARFRSDADTVLVTGIATTDAALRDVRWVVRPLRLRLKAGVIAGGRRAVRYSLRGMVAAAGGGALLLVDEIADVALRDSRATAVDAETHRVLAAQPLALRCP